MTFWIRDPKTGKPSVTVTMLWAGFMVCTFKLLMSDMTLFNVTFETFTGSDYAVALGALGALYSVRKHQHHKQENGNDLANEEKGI